MHMDYDIFTINRNNDIMIQCFIYKDSPSFNKNVSLLHYGYESFIVC